MAAPTENGAAATPTESTLGVTTAASVALDIGEGFGALVIYPAERYRECEIEVSPGDGHGHRVHTGVHERATFSGTIRLTAVFGSLAAGEYVIWADETTEGPVVTVTESAVTEITLR
jgi:hypothetical protein